MKALIFHIVSGLKVGGAEMMILRLISSASKDKYNHFVISLTPDGEMKNKFIEAGINLIILDVKNSPIINFWKLISIIRLSKPSVIQTWLYHADFLGGLASFIAGSYPVIWNIRSTSIPQGKLSLTFWLVRLCALSSYLIPKKIICCANSAKNAHVKLMYSEKKLTVIPNGFDFSIFDNLKKKRNQTRNALKLGADDMVIGAVGRFDRLKDFKNFVLTAKYLIEKFPKAKFIMIGRDNDWSNTVLESWIVNLGLRKYFYLLGEISDLTGFYSAMDIFCLSSIVEAFPNVVVEAMATGLPCVLTDAGDASLILDDPEYVVPVRNPLLLSEAILKICLLSSNEREFLGERNRKRVIDNYCIKEIANKYEEIYEQVIEK